nr:hypothetical protein [Neobacillus sp. Marseille-Q6967]
MNIQSEINYLQKQLLERLNVRIGSTLFTIIEAISRQAFVKKSFTVSQKNSTLATKCKVTASTISRNLKKIKEKCSDIIVIEQNRNVEERFASLVFTFIPQKMSNGMSNGGQTEPVNTGAEPSETSEITFSHSTNPLVLNKNTNINLHTNIVNKEVDNSKTIYEVYLEYASKGISKAVFQRVVKEIEITPRIINFKAYLRGALNNVVHHRAFKTGNIEINYGVNSIFYDWLHE